MGHTFVVKSLAPLGNDLLASSGYDSKIKIWSIKRMTLNHTFDVSINNNTNYMEGLVAIGKDMLSSASWDYYVRTFVRLLFWVEFGISIPSMFLGGFRRLLTFIFGGVQLSSRNT